jgi:hypothetical protein
MADSDPIQRVQYEDGIRSVKSAGATVYPQQEKNFAEKDGSDVEATAAQIADADLNRRKKQASWPRPATVAPRH